MNQSLPGAYFDSLYADTPDPWNFATSDYEREKYAATLANLPRPRYGSAFEIGCSIGILTGLLAERCDRLLAVDVAEAALAQARDNNSAHPNVQFRRMQIPQEWPDRRFDLMVFSEVLYYLSPVDLASAAEKAVASLEPGGNIVLVHWLGETNYPLGGEIAASHFIMASGLATIGAARTADYRLDVLG